MPRNYDLPKRGLLASEDGTTYRVPLANGRGYAIVDAQDAAEVGKHNWAIMVDKDHRTAYAVTTICRPARRTLRLHRLIGMRMGLPEEIGVDHESTDGLDCRRQNLRPASAAQNAFNRGPRSDSKTGIKGVWFHKGVGRYVAEITSRGVRKHLGYFDDPHAAGSAYAAAADVRHGRFARLSWGEAP